MCGTIRRTLNYKTRKDTTKILQNRKQSETWIISKADFRINKSTEIIFLRSVKGCTRLDMIRNDTIRKNLGIFVINEGVPK